MGTIAQELIRIQTAKADIKTAIEGKGVTVPSATTIDGYASLIGQISQGVQEAEENDVNFYDYDGFRVASFTIAEAKALTQAEYNAILPPSHEGLTFQEWNWTLNDITTYDRQYADIGANYITTDGKTHIFVNVTDINEKVEFSLNIKNDCQISVDWGDNSEIENYNASTSPNLTHQYSNVGHYEIKLTASPKTSGSTIVYGFMFNNSISSNIYEIRTGTAWCMGYTQGYQGLLSVHKDALYSTNVTSYFNAKHTNFPRISNVGLNANCLYVSLGKACFPKNIPYSFPVRYAMEFYTTRFVLPNSTSSSAKLNTDTINSQKTSSIISIPNIELNTNNTTYFSGCTSLKYIDIVQGWIPNNSINLSSSTRWTADTMVKFFNKLGTTTNAITLTFGSTNLNKLTADQKAIATNKGYTLA